MNLDDAMKRIAQLEEALMLMVYQYCVTDDRLEHRYMGYVPEMPSIRLSKYIEGEKLVLLINTDKKSEKQALQMKLYQKYFANCFNPRRMLSRTRLGSTPSALAISFTLIPR